MLHKVRILSGSVFTKYIEIDIINCKKWNHKMYDVLQDLRLFLYIVNAGSLTHASIRLGISLPALSRRLAALEKRLNTKLIERSARRFRLTEEGSILYEKIVPLLQSLEEIESEIIGRKNQLKGRLRVGCPLQYGKEKVAPIISELSKKYPLMNIELVLSDSNLNLIDNDLDIVFKINPFPNEDEVRHLILSSRRVCCASPHYLRLNGTPNKPEDLSAHRCICFMKDRHIYNMWRLKTLNSSQPFQVTPNLSSTSGELVHQWAVEGAGITFSLLWDVNESLKKGELVEILEEFNYSRVELYICYLKQTHTPKKISAFISEIIQFN